MSEHYYTVGVHGPPTKDTAPHGFMFKYPCDRLWHCAHVDDDKNVVSGSEMKWAPLSAPPTEQAPAPEPQPRWRAYFTGSYWGVGACLHNDEILPDEAKAAADALNALDRDGVAWGYPRPPETLPETRKVLVAWRSVVSIERAEYLHDQYVGEDESAFVGWWPLPPRAEA